MVYHYHHKNVLLDEIWSQSLIQVTCHLTILHIFSEVYKLSFHQVISWFPTYCTVLVSDCFPHHLSMFSYRQPPGIVISFVHFLLMCMSWWLVFLAWHGHLNCYQGNKDQHMASKAICDYVIETSIWSLRTIKANHLNTERPWNAYTICMQVNTHEYRKVMISVRSSHCSGDYLLGVWLGGVSLISGQSM